MTWEFKPGMKVVCVNADVIPPFVGVLGDLKLNEIYTIEWVGMAEYKGVSYLGVRISEIPSAVNHPSYRPLMSQRFRPLQSKGMDLLNEIVQGVNTGLLVVEDEKYMTKFRKSQRKKQDA